MQPIAEYLRLFFENMSELVAIEELVYDESGEAVDWRYLEVNPAFAAGVNKTREQLIGRRAGEVWGEGRTPVSFLDHFRKAVETGKPQYFEDWFNPLGKCFLLTVVPLGGSRFAAISSDITGRKEMEDALRESEERYRTIANYTYDWELWRSPAGEFIYCSPSCERITGYPPEAFIADPGLIERIVHPEDRELATGRCGASPREPLIAEDYRIIRADGEVRWISHVCQTVADSDGRPLGVRASNRDITDRKRFEEYLQRYAAISGNARDIILLLEPEGRIVEVNRAAELAYGYTQQEMLALDIRDLRVPEDVRTTDEQMKTAMRKGILFETVHRRKDGTVFPVEVNSRGAEIGGRVLLLSVVRDVTERKQVEHALEVERRRLEAVLDSLPVGVILSDAEGSVVGANKQTASIWGFSGSSSGSLEQFLATCDWWADSGELLQRDDFPLLRAVRFATTTFGERIHIQRVDGARATVLASAAPIRDASGVIAGGVLAVQDVTEQEVLRRQIQDALEETRREAHRNAALQAVSESGIAATSFLDLLDTLCRTVAESLGVPTSAVMLWEDPTGDLVVSAVYGAAAAVGHRFRPDEGLAERLRADGRTVFINAADTDDLRLPRELLHGGALVATTLIARGRLLGVVVVGSDASRELSDYDIGLFESMASRAALWIDNVQLYDALVASQGSLRDALQKEREYSRMLQRALLPRLPRVQEGFSSVATYTPALAEAEIGGDFYDVFRAGDGWLGVLIGDVSGKGLEAAAMAATTRSTVHAYAHQTSSAAQALTQANAVLTMDQPEFGSFVTVFLAIVNMKTGEFTFSSGGHPPAMVVRSDGSLRPLSTGAPPLALLEAHVFPEGAGMLEPGEKLVAYTDGISEARRGSDMLEVSGIESLLRQHAHATPSDIAAALMTTATEFAGGRLTDDAAIVVVERLAETTP